VDVPAPDVNTTGQIMGWMVEEMSKFKTQNSKLKNNEILATFTGKLVENGGSLGRNEATGRGGVIILAELAEKLNMKPNEITIAVQGIGNVGFWFAKLASEMGFKVVAVSDSRGGIVQELGARSSELGLTMEEVLEYKEKHGQVQGLDGTVSITNEELLELPVDVLVPAALENVINNLNADKIKAKVVIEMANGPVTPEADKVLLDRGIISVPDILANSGGVSVSYYEWVQNLENEKWTEAQVNEKLAMKMKKAFGQVWEKFLTLNDANGNKGARSWELGASKDNKRSIKVNMRTAAYVVAIGRVVEKMG
jgi:glutamate dehydrogenase/leucine dehydrogenase